MAVGGINKWVSSRKARGSRSDEPASKHQIQPINGVWGWTDERANAGRVGDRTRLSRPTFRARTGTGKNSSLPFQLTYKQRIVNNHIIRLIHTFFVLFFNLTYSRWTSLPSCLWSQRIFPSLPGPRLTIFFYRDASSALLRLVNQWLNFTTHVPTLSVTKERTQILLW